MRERDSEEEAEMELYAKGSERRPASSTRKKRREKRHDDGHKQEELRQLSEAKKCPTLQRHDMRYIGRAERAREGRPAAYLVAWHGARRRGRRRVGRASHKAKTKQKQ